jgi:hypothetical protein
VTTRASDRPDGPDVEIPRLLTVEDIGRMLSIGPRGARKVLERGEIPSLRLGGRLWVRLEDLEARLSELVKVERERRSVDPGRILRGLSARRAADRR